MVISNPFSSRVSRHIIFTWLKSKIFSFKNGWPVCASRIQETTRHTCFWAIKTSLEKTALHVELFWAWDGWSFVFKELQRIWGGQGCRAGTQKCEVRMASALLYSDGNQGPFLLASLSQIHSSRKRRNQSIPT